MEILPTIINSSIDQRPIRELGINWVKMKYFEHEAEIDNGIENEEHHEGFLIIQNVVFDGGKDVMIKSQPCSKSLSGVSIVIGMTEEGIQ
jgi:hypothetical protein